MHDNPQVIEQRLRGLALEIAALETEIAALSHEAGGIAIQREISKASDQLSMCREQWQGEVAERQSQQARPAALESDPEATRRLAFIPEGASFPGTLRMLVPALATTPDSLCDEHQMLVLEGHEAPFQEVVQSLREEMLAGLLNRTDFSPECLNPLQDSLIDAMAHRLVSQVIREIAP